MVEEHRTIVSAEGEFGILIRRPDSRGPHPVIVFFHHGPGMDDGSKQAMQILADEDYLVVAPDRHHRHGSWLTFDVPKLMSSGSGFVSAAGLRVPSAVHRRGSGRERPRGTSPAPR